MLTFYNADVISELSCKAIVSVYRDIKMFNIIG